MKTNGFGRSVEFGDVARGSLFITQDRNGLHWCIKGYEEHNGDTADLCVVISPSNPDFSNKPGIWGASVLGQSVVYEITGAIFGPVYEDEALSIERGYNGRPGDVFVFCSVPYLCVLSGTRDNSLVNIETGEIRTRPPETEYVRISKWKVYREIPDRIDVICAWPKAEGPKSEARL